jgi:leader peptidase (prepilin peptidase)/N-methyltransferase
MTSALLALSVIDFRTYEIPYGFTVFLLAIGLFRLFTDLDNWKLYVMVCLTSAYFCCNPLLSGGRAMVGAISPSWRPADSSSAGRISSWRLFWGRHRFDSPPHPDGRETPGSVLAFGPYLAAGVFIAACSGATDRRVSESLHVTAATNDVQEENLLLRRDISLI